MAKESCTNIVNFVHLCCFVIVVTIFAKNTVDATMRKLTPPDKLYYDRPVHDKSSEDAHVQDMLESYDFQDHADQHADKTDESRSYEYNSYETADDGTEEMSESDDSSYVGLPFNQMHEHFDLKKWMSFLNDTRVAYESQMMPFTVDSKAITQAPDSMNTLPNVTLSPQNIPGKHYSKHVFEDKQNLDRDIAGSRNHSKLNQSTTFRSERPKHMHLHLHLHISEGQLLGRDKRSKHVKRWTHSNHNRPVVSLSWPNYVSRYLQKPSQNDSVSLSKLRDALAYKRDIDARSNDGISINAENDISVNTRDSVSKNVKEGYSAVIQHEYAKDDKFTNPKLHSSSNFNDVTSSNTKYDIFAASKDFNSKITNDTPSPIDHILSSFKYLTPLIQAFVNRSPSLSFNLHVDKHLKTDTFTLTPSNRSRMANFVINYTDSGENMTNAENHDSEEKVTNATESLFSIILRSVPKVVEKPTNLSDDKLWSRTLEFGRSSIWGHYIDRDNETVDLVN